ncbi:class I SAM-dependent methyltransferase [Candidatus Latescibacterota bacterium]
MTKNTNWHERYTSGQAGWDIGRPDFNLIDIVTKRPVHTCKALEIGCGTGDNTFWLARQGFTVTGADITEEAIQRARDKSTEYGFQCTFITADFLEQSIDGAPFGFVFDRGCFHSFDTYKERKRFAENAAAHLESGGLWLSLVGSSDDPPREKGPPQRSATDIVTAIEPFFEILSLDKSHFESDRPTPPGAWVCMMRKRP